MSSTLERISKFAAVAVAAVVAGEEDREVEKEERSEIPRGSEVSTYGIRLSAVGLSTPFNICVQYSSTSRSTLRGFKEEEEEARFELAAAAVVVVVVVARAPLFWEERKPLVL